MFVLDLFNDSASSKREAKQKINDIPAGISVGTVICISERVHIIELDDDEFRRIPALNQYMSYITKLPFAAATKLENSFFAIHVILVNKCFSRTPSEELKDAIIEHERSHIVLGHLKNGVCVSNLEILEADRLSMMRNPAYKQSIYKLFSIIESTNKPYLVPEKVKKLKERINSI
jgi:hypothetical protein